MSFDHLLILTNHGKLLANAGRHRNDTRKDTRLHCSDFSALKNPTTYSDTRSSPLLHLEDRSDHHVLLLVVELVHHIFCLLQELIQSVWQRMIKSGLNEMTLVWKVKNLKRPWGSHGAKNLQPGFGPHKYPGVSFPLETDAGAQTIPCEALHKPL